MSSTRKFQMIFLHLFVLILSLRTCGAISRSGSAFIRCSNDSTTFRCSSAEVTHCISTESVCDGSLDCPDGSDETEDCLPNCSEGWFRCKNGHCISSSWVCDGQNDCLSGDASDEENCPAEGQPPPSYTCRGGDIRCSDGLCIPASWQCDGERDCYAGDDEAPEVCAGKTPPQCGDKFGCSSGECLDQSWVCDGWADCEDQSDEADCLTEGEPCELAQGRFLCADFSRCLPAGQVCDGEVQCPDRSDEADWCGSQPQLSCAALNCSSGCVRTPGGPRCYCQPGFTLAEDLRSCSDTDECGEFGSCSQDCHNTPGTFSCSCRPGYEMVNSSCLTTNSEPLLIFSTVTEIRALGVRSLQYFPVVSSQPHVVGVGYDHLSSRIYWTDVHAGRESILSAQLSTNFSKTDSRLEISGEEELVTAGLDMPEQLAVDAVNQNLYFTDSQQRQVGVCSLSGSGCSVLVGGLERPRGVALHQSSSQLVVSDWGSTPRIIILALDGSNQRDLVSEDLAWPNGLAVDQLTDRVYWADSRQDVIESVDLLGRDRRTILTSRPKHPFSLAVFEDRLYWSDWETLEIVSCNKFTGKELRVVMKESGLRPMGLVIAHPLVVPQMSEPSPCSSSACSHVCLPSSPPENYRCACPQQMVLDGSGQICVDDPAVPRLLISDSASFYQVSPHGLGKANLSFVTTILPSQVEKVASVAEGSNIFLSSQGQSGNLLSLDVTGSSVKRLKTVDRVGSVAFDPATGNLYWVDVNRKAVNVFSTKTNKNFEVLVSEDVPQHILFVPEKNRLLLAHPGYVAIIYVPSKETKIVRNLSLNSVSSMVYSYSQDSVFIADYTDPAIHKLELKTGTFSKFLPDLTSGVTSLAIAGDYLYWIERSRTNLLLARLDNPADVSWQELDSFSPSDLLQLTSFQRSPLTPSSACLTAGCSHVCFQTDPYGFQCSCPLGLQLQADGKTCRPEPGCSSRSGVFTCRDGQCLPHQFQCDGSADCEGGEDEADCEARHDAALACSNNATQFLCGDGKCIPTAWLCDGDGDCLDRSDEPSSCPPQVCSDGWRACSEGMCVLDHWFCDGEEDCHDGSDETHCNVTCPGGQVLCKDRQLCILESWRCDSREDCNDGSDEADCPTKSGLQCQADEFHCENGNCVAMDLFCDGDDNCGDNSDEAEAVCHRISPAVSTVPCETGLACGSLCLPMSARCNGTYECFDLTDEMNCSPCFESKPTFSCRSDGQCVPETWRCDGTADCRDASDEEGCAPAEDCGLEEYRCSSGECVQLSQVCDGSPHCGDGSDEHEAQCVEACRANGGCGELCLPTPSGPVCRCQPGHQVVSTGEGEVEMCEDVDECLLVSSCAQLCTNTKGSYKCSCHPGFTQEHRHCRAQGDPARLLYAVGGKVEGLTLRGDSLVRSELEMSSQELEMRSYDFNLLTGQFYWTSPARGIVGRHRPESRDNEVWLEGLERPDQVAVDWLTGNVYLSHSASPDLTVCSSSGLCLPLTTAPVIVTQVRLDPGAGLMFVAGYHRNINEPSRAGGVYPYTMAGRPVEEAEIMGGGIPTGLTLDTEMRRVYWTDFPSYEINMCDYLGKRCSKIIKTSHDLPNFIAFFESKLFWISGDEGHLFSYDIVGQNLSLRAKLPRHTHSLRFAQSGMVRLPAQPQPCSSLPCAGVCLLSGSEAECLAQSPPHTTDNVARTRTNRLNGGTIALAVILAFAGVAALSVIFYKCKAAPKTELSLSFTNSGFNPALPGIRRRQEEPDQELSSVQVVRQGTTQAYDNPGFESPWARPRGTGHGLYAPDSLDISSADGIVFSGSSSTPAMVRQQQDTDSAYQELSIAPSLAASSCSELNQRHFSVVDEDEDSPFCARDQQRLIMK